MFTKDRSNPRLQKKKNSIIHNTLHYKILRININITLLLWLYLDPRCFQHCSNPLLKNVIFFFFSKNIVKTRTVKRAITLDWQTIHSWLVNKENDALFSRRPHLEDNKKEDALGVFKRCSRRDSLTKGAPGTPPSRGEWLKEPTSSERPAGNLKKKKKKKWMHSSGRQLDVGSPGIGYRELSSR